jgi:hypothetical protein
MNATERVWYILMYSYVAFGLGYYLKKGFSAYQEREKPVPLIGILERMPSDIDHLFVETGITRLD